MNSEQWQSGANPGFPIAGCQPTVGGGGDPIYLPKFTEILMKCSFLTKIGS